EAPASAFAALYQRLASRRLAGIDSVTMDAIQEALQRSDDKVWGTNFSKDGNLASDPVTQVRAGWWQTSKGPMVYVVMTAQGLEATEERLGKTADDLMNALGSAGWNALSVDH